MTDASPGQARPRAAPATTAASSTSASGGSASTAQIRPGNLLRYIRTRKVWNPTGGMKEWLYVKKGL